MCACVCMCVCLQVRVLKRGAKYLVSIKNYMALLELKKKKCFKQLIVTLGDSW